MDTNIKDRQVSLLNEAKAMAFFFGVSSEDLSSAFKSFDELYSSPDHVSADEFHQALNTIDQEIEALCIVHKISQEALEEKMENNFAFKAVVV